MAEKTPGQVARNAYFKNEAWERLNREARDDWDAVAAAVIAHVREQIEREARAKAVEDALIQVDRISRLRGLYVSDGQDLVKAIRALATLPSRFVVISKEPDIEVLQSMHDRMWEGAARLKPGTVDYAMWVEVYKAMIAARK